MVTPLPGREFFLLLQKLVLRPLLFSLYINKLPDGIQSICKIFADGTSLFSKYQDFKKSEQELNKDLYVIMKN